MYDFIFWDFLLTRRSDNSYYIFGNVRINIYIMITMAIAGTNEFSNRYSTYVENSDRKPVGSDENNVQQRTALKFPYDTFRMAIICSFAQWRQIYILGW